MSEIYLDTNGDGKYEPVSTLTLSRSYDVIAINNGPNSMYTHAAALTALGQPTVAALQDSVATTTAITASTAAGGGLNVNDLVLMSGEDPNLNRMATYQSGSYKRLTATGSVKASAGVLVGFYVNSTTGGTIVLWDNTSAAAPQISGTITPAIGYHKFPAIFTVALWAVIANTLDVTFFYE